MSDVFSITRSGLQAASQRVAVGANNVVNQNTAGFVASEVSQVSQGERGGVATAIRPGGPALLLAHESGGESFAAPGHVDTAREMVSIRAARHAYQASLSLIRSDDEMGRQALNLIS